ncbi:delta subunit of the central stalk of mitochondrial F1F0 ATP synthase, atp16 [Hanseniaspora osmophila]|uniref:ATP synthase subunit delta, mitochondrial n=1 Tax=Hanseniaspora osmophila TaxID=56408 RepID=A0A1E5R0B1_9ASCO|nr:ATP synthase subunit delta, mitochondrial [Hanseniaspora osmophila]
MFSRRLLLQAVKARTYATESAAETLKLQFALPHKTLFKNASVAQVNLPVQSGSIGVLANHVPIVEQLTPGVVEVFETLNGTPKKFFVSGGFANIQPDSVLNITSVEAFPLEEFDSSAIKSLIQEASKNVTSSNEEVATKAQIELDVLENLQASLKA